MQFGGQPANYLVDVIGDWGAHLQPLLENGSYDIGYPWFKPDCSNTANLGRASTWRCENLLWSRPLHEIVVTFYGREGEVENISTPSDASGMTLCRPDGYFTHDLEAAGLVAPTITRVAPATPEECFEMLAAKEVDLVSVNIDTSDRIIQSLGMEERTAEVIELSTIQTSCGRNADQSANSHHPAPARQGTEGHPGKRAVSGDRREASVTNGGQ